MNEIEINKIRYIADYILEMEFSDSSTKQYDFQVLITFRDLGAPLLNADYFRSVKIVDKGRAFAWDNGYRFSADWIRYFANDIDHEWLDYDNNTSLEERIEIVRKKMYRPSMFISNDKPPLLR